MLNPRIALAACAVLLTAAAAAFPSQSASSFALDLSPLQRVSTEPSLEAGTYAAEDPHPSHHHHTTDAHHHNL